MKTQDYSLHKSHAKAASDTPPFLLDARESADGRAARAMWEETKFGTRHFRDIERLAMEGETKWQHGMALSCKPFTTAEVGYFVHDKASSWLREA